MGVLQNYESAEGRERWKWEHSVTETHPSDPTIKGMRPETPQRFPAMLYRCLDRAALRFEAIIVHSETEEANMTSRGYVPGGQSAALDAYDRFEQTKAVAAAERAFHDSKMSPQAQAEAEAVDLQTISHLGEIPRQPVKRRGRPKKAKPEDVTTEE